MLKHKLHELFFPILAVTAGLAFVLSIGLVLYTETKNASATTHRKKEVLYTVTCPGIATPMPVLGAAVSSNIIGSDHIHIFDADGTTVSMFSPNCTVYYAP